MYRAGRRPIRSLDDFPRRPLCPAEHGHAQSEANASIHVGWVLVCNMKNFFFGV